jgi:hypothetical protein
MFLCTCGGVLLFKNCLKILRQMNGWSLTGPVQLNVQSVVK